MTRADRLGTSRQRKEQESAEMELPYRETPQIDTFLLVRINKFGVEKGPGGVDQSGVLQPRLVGSIHGTIRFHPGWRGPPESRGKGKWTIWIITSTHKYTHTETHRNTHTHTQRGRQTDRQTDRQTHTHTQAINRTQTHTYTCVPTSKQHRKKAVLNGDKKILMGKLL